MMPVDLIVRFQGLLPRVCAFSLLKGNLNPALQVLLLLM